ncbi:hypothetical protein [Burkholderia gladioli]|uniref:hypothetical protein n=1 Tax=Burkholderia gladioli TaxID=28095 RepID=UPI00163E9A88|nr:hypothetical protein [Burkholderia gladioli]
MARTAKDARDSAALEEVAETTTEHSLSELLAAALADAPVGPAHGALSAIEIALIELKRRAKTVDQHLGDEFEPILERIKAL